MEYTYRGRVPVEVPCIYCRGKGYSTLSTFWSVRKKPCRECKGTGNEMSYLEGVYSNGMFYWLGDPDRQENVRPLDESEVSLLKSKGLIK